MREPKECTVMFYFASDNPLAISIVSQLKAIKAAGFHREANVIVHYDPVTEGTPTHIFDVNVLDKLRNRNVTQIGSNGVDPFRNLVEDRLWGIEIDRNGEEIRGKIAEIFRDYDPPQPNAGREARVREENEKKLRRGQRGASNGTPEPGGEPSPERSLRDFLKLGSAEYPARHYVLFILGHGVVVGNDVFLFDENAEEQTLKLGKLGGILRDFSLDVKAIGGEFDLIGFHSCSVSSLEVAYELQGTAKYMLASQGTAFVGSWPYRQILMRVFEDLKNDLDVKHKSTLDYQTITNMLDKIFSYVFHNSADFLLAGYPFDLCLCDLSKIPTTIHKPLARLSKALVEGLKNPETRRQCANLTVLAHWKSQSFYQEMYTDLYDFCSCLKSYIEDFLKDSSQPLRGAFEEMQGACDDVINALEPNQGFIVRSDFAGPELQYSHGLSLYFPWSAPPENRGILAEYAKYRISDFDQQPTWLEFLKEYFDKTMRDPRSEESDEERKLDPEKQAAVPLRTKAPELYEDMINSVYTREGPHNGQNALDQGAKTDPKDPTGGECNCPSIKNYPKYTRTVKERKPEASIMFRKHYYSESSA